MDCRRRITTLEGLNAFWNRYGWELEEYGRKQYSAHLLQPGSLPHVNEPIIADSLTELMFAVGDKMMTPHQ